MKDYKRYLHDRSAEFRDLEQPAALSYIEEKNRRALDAWKLRRCRTDGDAAPIFGSKPDA